MAPPVKYTDPVTESTAEPNTGCYLYEGTWDKDGYGEARYDRKKFRAHRLSYMLHKGPIPDGMSVLHQCDTPCCVNPEHLFLGTQKENVRDAMTKGRWTQKPGQLCRERNDNGAGLKAWGIANPELEKRFRSVRKSTYTPQQREEILALRANGLSHRAIAKIVGGDHGMVARSLAGKYYKEDV